MTHCFSLRSVMHMAWVLLTVIPTISHAQWQVRYDVCVRSPTRQYKVLVIENQKLTVDFVPHVFWTVHELQYRKTKLNQATGYTGSVFHWDGQPIGTGHRTEHHSEQLIDVTLQVDDQTYRLDKANGKPANLDFTASGQQISLIKRSTIGPMAHQARFDFDPDITGYTVTHRYEVLIPITPKRFAGYRYVFMQMMPKTISRWCYYDEDGKQTCGTMSEPDPAKPMPKNQFVFKDAVFKGIACYSPTEQMGIAYSYPKQYPGTNHYLDRAAKDSKFRGILFEKDQYQVGEKLTWQMRVLPFDATGDNWQTIGWQIIQPTW